ncbi:MULTISPECIES: HAMP domain-containing sensor histidine kinase [unclassified Streptomyces]|uniref:sensor histidine kinase n=1 Tax=unclassified Streptomyces TaxID=2593676 RepID=UPI002DD86F15|nr:MULTISPECIES: HAMP domain-containing sensor histidine kinase [unclassified Streptomyces]WSB75737.1 HAMP domain-containing histidine kinase [Streptomyces sp. NBC_01775]WSS15978.1 HAMP domain-containing histidine kinase [Streptomyces sp. NBC_01186]WSS44796.1 HAMP domain-containing histidine kinase [Streptomyces sp. NBC_01187]
MNSDGRGRVWNSERTRLTALYTGLLVLAGTLLTGLVYFLVRESLDSRIGTAVRKATPMSKPSAGTHFGRAQPSRTEGLVRGGDIHVTREVSNVAGDAALSRLLTVSAVSLAVFTLVFAALAWWMAGRVLHPVGVITARARQLSGANLHERLDLKSRGGELKELADTFDQMLDRIEHLVAARQRFAANAAHELRTSLAVQRAAAEIGLADDPPPEKVTRMRRKLIENAEDSERLIESLLLLAVSDRQLQRSEQVALHDITARCAEGLRDEAARRSVTLHVETAEPLSVDGDPVLLEHTVHNLVSNGLRYNHPGGTVRVRVGEVGLEVANTGPKVPSADVPRLFEPFRRAEERGRRQDPSDGGAGLGLSIVASIARAHGADTRATANHDGGLTVRVLFPHRPMARP